MQGDSALKEVIDRIVAADATPGDTPEQKLERFMEKHRGRPLTALSSKARAAGGRAAMVHRKGGGLSDVLR